MFKIDFERAFSHMDKDHINAVGVYKNIIYVQWHYRNRIIYPNIFIEAHNERIGYKCKNNEEALSIFTGIAGNTKKVWNELIHKKELIEEK